MLKQCKRGMGVVLAILAVVQLTGCKEVTKLTLLKKVAEQVSQAESYAMNMKMSLEAGGSVSGITVNIGMDMDLNMDINQEPQVIHTKGTLSMNALGQNQEIPLEMYSLEENGKTMVYTDSNGTWTKEEGEEFGKMTGTLGAEQYLSMAESVELEKETKDVAGQECYILTGSIKGDLLESAMGTMIETFEESGLLEDLNFSKTQIPIQLYIEKKDFYPVRMTMDMKSIMEEAFEAAIAQGGVEFTCDTCTMEMEFSSFNQLENIELPEEVKVQSATS